MLESNPPRNDRWQTHQDDEAGANRETASPWRKEKTHRIDRSAHSSKNSSALPTTTIQDGRGGLWNHGAPPAAVAAALVRQLRGPHFSTCP